MESKTPDRGRAPGRTGHSLDHFGIRDDLKVWPNPEQPGRYFVLDGNQRLDVFRERGQTGVECRILDDLDPDDAKLFTAAFDRNHAMYDFRKLAELSESIKTKADSLRQKLLWLPRVNLPQPAITASETLTEAVNRPAAEAAETVAKAPEAGSIPVVFSLTRQGYEEVRALVLTSRNRLIRESRLTMALQALEERGVDDLVVETALRIAAK